MQFYRYSVICRSPGKRPTCPGHPSKALKRVSTCFYAAALIVTGLETASAASLSVLSRNYMLQTDYRSKDAAQSLSREWAQGFIGEFKSDVTEGAVGAAIDLHGFVGLKLDGGRGHAGTGLLPIDSDGRSRSEYASAGGALRLVAAATTLSIGEMQVETPVFDTGDKRLQPEYATGWLLTDRTLTDITFTAGRFTAFKNQNSSSARGEFDGYGGSTRFGGISLAGFKWAKDASPFGGALYAARLDDVWAQYYSNVNLRQGAWLMDANLYRTSDTGASRSGSIDNWAYSMANQIRRGGHTLTLGYQKIQGDTPFDFVGGDSIYLSNSIKFSDFNGAGESSWLLRYKWNAEALGLSGLTITTAYVRGSRINGTSAPRGGAYNAFDPATDTYHAMQGKGGRHWERDVEVRYVVQSGPAKDLSLTVAHVSHRANTAQAGPDIDRLYLIAQYPVNMGF